MTLNKAFSHERTENTKNEWLTPPELIKSLGDFDLDPCSPIESKRPWPTAKNHYDIETNGLLQKWHGRVWCNPPYDNKICEDFLEKCVNHGNCMVLIFARVETKNWFNYIWNKADSVLFIRGRIKFYHVSGEIAANSGGAPSALIAYGKNNSDALINSKINGMFIPLKQ